MGKGERKQDVLKQARDPVVQAEIARQERADKQRQMTRAQRRKAKADAERTKATFDLPAELITALSETAEAESVSTSNLVAELLIRAVNDYRKGRLVLDNDKQSARSLKWDWKIELSELDAGVKAGVVPA